MRIVVIPHEQVVPILRVWRRTLGDTTAERNQRYAELWGEFVGTIVAAGGPPRHAIKVDTHHPPSYWCDFPGNGHARSVFEPAKRVGLFSWEQRVVVMDLIFSPDLPG